MKKIYKVFNGGTLPIKGGISGPILVPVELEMDEVFKLVNLGFDIREVNPYNKKESIRLTRLNVGKVTFTKPEKKTNETVYEAPKPGDKLFPKNPKVLPKKFVNNINTPDFF